MNYFYDSLLLVVMILMCFYYLAGQSVTILKKCEIGEKMGKKHDNWRIR